MHNIAEGFDAGTDLEFIRFLKIARRSGSEVQSQLYLALDRNYIIEQERQRAYGMADDTKRLINGPIGYLRQSKSTGKIAEERVEYIYSSSQPDDLPAPSAAEEFGSLIDQDYLPDQPSDSTTDQQTKRPGD
jgi:hypothetical protein